MKKIIHVHSDRKFISDSEKFNGEFFINELLILETKNSFNEAYHNKALFFEPNPVNLNNILAIVNSADILVLYNLDFFKDQVKRILPFLFQNEISFYRAIKRSDAFVSVFKDEYKYLIKHWNHLPIFIRLSQDGLRLYSKEINFELEYPKSNTVVIGNSRSQYNNHLDILESIETCDLDQKINIKLLFNYGPNNKYTQKVREKADCIANVTLIDSFITSNEFIDFYGPVAAFVNNSFRQMALGNIFMALHRGVKVYLNKKNPTYPWLKNEGLYIYEIKDLKNDLETGHIHLTKSEIEHNLKCLKKLKEDYTKTDFQLQVLELLNN